MNFYTFLYQPPRGPEPDTRFVGSMIVLAENLDAAWQMFLESKSEAPPAGTNVAIVVTRAGCTADRPKTMTAEFHHPSVWFRRVGKAFPPLVDMPPDEEFLYLT